MVVPLQSPIITPDGAGVEFFDKNDPIPTSARTSPPVAIRTRTSNPASTAASCPGRYSEKIPLLPGETDSAAQLPIFAG